jgi:ribose transport system ATP-binding protein
VKTGTVRVAAFTGVASPTDRLAQGVGLLSEDRKGEGLALGMSIADNLTLSKLGGLGAAGFISPQRKERAAAAWIERVSVRCRDPHQPIGELSGGNQQKIAFARLLHHDVDVLLLDEPTRGIDVGSKAQIYKLIDELVARGKAVLLVSSYLPEILGLCDRIAVMRRGTLLDARPAAELTEHALLLEATGA